MRAWMTALFWLSVLAFAAALGALFLILLPGATITAIACHSLLLVAGCAMVLAVDRS